MSGKGKTSPKKPTSKQKEIPKIVTKTKSIESPETPKESALSFPLLKTVDNARTLPRYSAVMSRPDEEGVGMEDLDGLQLELETLLSAVVVRTRVLQEEIRILSDEEEKRDKTKQNQALKKSNPVGRPSLKRSKNQDEASKKFREAHSSRSDLKPAVASPIKFTKVKTVSLVSNPLNQHLNLLEPDVFESRLEGRKVISPKNDTPNKFWASVEPYCAEITHEDIKLLQDLITEQENQEYYKVPQLGKHYTHRWGSEDLSDDQATGSQGKSKKSLTETTSGIVKKEKVQDTSALNSGPLTQRLVSALLEENFTVVEKKPGNEKAGTGPENEGPKPPTILRSFSMNFEQSLRKKLEDQGIVDPPEATKEEDDEILSDIKRCQSEMKTITNHNLQQLRRILKSAEQEMARQELNKKLEAIDAEICDLYRKIQLNKLKKKPPIKKEQEQAWKALKDRELLIQQIDSI